MRHGSPVAPLLAAFLLLGPGAARAVDESISQDDVEKVAAAIREFHDRAKEELEKLPLDRFDRGPIIDRVGTDAKDLADWVRHDTRFVPYRGVLRGAEGVLLDRRGNSLDRSLLLAALLEDAGYEVRLVRGELSASDAQSLLRTLRAEHPEPLAPDGFAAGDRTIVARAAEQAEALARLAPPTDRLPTEGGEADVADHWWVEARLGAEWRSHDPLLAGPLATLRPEVTGRFAPDALPADLYHLVTLRVVIERWEEGRLIEETPLEHALRVADAALQPLELQFVPFGFEPAPADSDAGGEAVALADTTRDWLPVLRAGREHIRQQGFGADGRLERNPARPAVGRKLSRAADALGGLGRSVPPPATVLTACWIDYAIESPGRRPEVVRREIFDLVGPERRGDEGPVAFSLDAAGRRERGLALAGVSDILVTGAAVPPVALAKAYLELWAEQGHQIAAFARLLRDPDAAEPLGRFFSRPLVPLDLVALAAGRTELSRHRDAVYVGSPNILSTHYLPRLGDGLEAPRAVDIVANAVGAVAGDAVAASRIQLEQGVLDTLLEQAMAPGESTADNAAELFSRRGEATGPWAATRQWPEDSPLPAAARARMEAAVAAGRIVVAPESLSEGTPPAWWEIDPETGATLGIGPRGWGQAGVEDASTRTIATGGAQQGARKTGQVVFCEVLFAYWKAQGYIVTWYSKGVVVLPPELVGQFLASGCKGGPWLVL